MNIEELSKSQLILLTILVNFVTSIATGILTVSLLDQAPPALTQSINHIVERTVQTVIPSAPAALATAPSVTTSDQDQVTSAIAADAARAVTLYDLSSSSTPRATGTFIPEKGVVIVPAASSRLQEARAVFANGSVATATLAIQSAGVDVYRFPSNAVLPSVPAVRLVPAHELVLGEMALVVTADGSASAGIVSHIKGGIVNTTLPSLAAGSAVVDISGNLIGIMGGNAGDGLISADTLTRVLMATSTPLQ